MKLRWAKMSGGSEKQIGDARGVYELQGPTLDLEYMDYWACALDISELWKKTKSDADPG